MYFDLEVHLVNPDMSGEFSISFDEDHIASLV